ncbi:hypothetical protein ACJX0J_031052, partial [Zea mays]
MKRSGLSVPIEGVSVAEAEPTTAEADSDNKDDDDILSPSKPSHIETSDATILHTKRILRLLARLARQMNGFREAYDYGYELNRVMYAFIFEYPDYERLDEESRGAKKNRVQDVPEKTADTSSSYSTGVIEILKKKRRMMAEDEDRKNELYVV